MLRRPLSSSSSILKRSFSTLRPLVSSSTGVPVVEKQVLVGSRGFRNFHHFITAGYSVGSRPVRDVINGVERLTSKILWIRPFSSDSGDLVDAVVPFMGESITDGTLAKFLKSPGNKVEADEPIAQIETDKVCGSQVAT